jgi:hypothetical protein
MPAFLHRIAEDTDRSVFNKERSRSPILLQLECACVRKELYAMVFDNQGCSIFKRILPFHI